MKLRHSQLGRATLYLTLASGAAALTLLLTSSRSAQSASSRVRIRGRCSACHKASASEWAESKHRMAYQDPAFVELSNNYEKKECLGCHAPENVQTKDDTGALVPRDSNRESGVDCAGCHQDAEGQHHHHTKNDDGTVTETPINPLTICSTCHAKNGTVDEFKTTKWGTDDSACAKCHMPEVRRPRAGGEPEGLAHVHAFACTKDLEFVKQGLPLTLAVEGGKVVAKLTNEAAAHNFPTGEPTKQVVVEVTLDDLTKRVVLAKTADGDTRLAPGQTLTVELPTEGKTGKAAVRVLHKSHADLPDDQAVVLLTAEVDG